MKLADHLIYHHGVKPNDRHLIESEKHDPDANKRLHEILHNRDKSVIHKHVSNGDDYGHNNWAD